MNAKVTLKIFPKGQETTWEAITDLLHEAFNEHLQKGISYAACLQDVETTQRRVGKDGICLVAYKNEDLIGTATIHEMCYKGLRYCYLSQFAVSSHHRGGKVGEKIFNEVVKIAKTKSVSYIYVDTPISARNIINWYKRIGFEKIGLISGKKTGYYSVLLRYPIYRNKSILSNLIFLLSAFRCLLLWKANGQSRFK